MNLIWMAVIVAALAFSIGVFVVAGGIILLFTRRRKWWIRAFLVCLPGLALCYLWSTWLGPHELTGEKELAERFELVFHFAPDTYATDLHYQIQDGPDAMVEWFRFRADPPQLERLSANLVQVKAHELNEAASPAPDWWFAASTEGLSFYRGSVETTQASDPFTRDIWIAHDPANRLVYCCIHSLL